MIARKILLLPGGHRRRRVQPARIVRRHLWYNPDRRTAEYSRRSTQELQWNELPDI